MNARKHAYDTGLRKKTKGQRSSRASLSVEVAIKIKQEYERAKGNLKKAPYGTKKALSKKYNVPKHVIKDMLAGFTYKYLVS